MIQDFSDILASILCFLGYICTVRKFCKEYLEISVLNEKLFMVLLFLGDILIIILNIRYPIPYIFLALMNHVILGGLVFLLFGGNWEKKILIVSVLITLTTLVENFCTSFFSYLILLWLHTVKNIETPFLDKRETNLILCISLIIAISVIYQTSKYLAPVFYCKTRKWYIILAIPLFLVTSVIDVANWGASHGILVRSGGNMGLYYDQIFSHAEFCVLTILSMFAAGFYVIGMNQLYLEQQKNFQYHSQISSYKILEEQYSQSERLRHDLKNHIIALMGLLENKELEKMAVYLKTMGDSVNLGINEEITGNRIVDVFLSQKRKLAENKNIIWECDVQIPKICYISEYDLCVLLGNILDNAVEACEKSQSKEANSTSKQFINIQAGVIKKCFLLEVRNSTDMLDKPNIGFTNKENPSEHGIGLLNISDVVHKYNGVMDIEIRNSVFTISVLIPLNNAVHNIKQDI